MPYAQELAEIVVNGVSYRDWVSVMVNRTYGSPTSAFEFVVSERTATGGQRSWSDLKLNVGDKAQVYLAGQKVIDGYIEVRQVGYSAQEHTVAFQGRSKTADIVDSSAKPAQFKGYALKPIVNRLMDGMPVEFVLMNPPAGVDRPFENFAVGFGETVFEAIERLCRMRGLMLTDDKDGNLVAFNADPKALPVGDLVEGRNILQARAILRDDAAFSLNYVATQRQGSDDAFASHVSWTGAVAQNPGIRPWRNLILIAEEPGTGDDARTRADHEVARQNLTAVDISIIVQGWQRAPGALWNVTENCTLVSPMIFPTDNGTMNLAIRSVTYLQDAQGGTKTQLDLCLPNALSLTGDPGVKGQVPDVLAANQPAKSVGPGSEFT